VQDVPLLLCDLDGTVLNRQEAFRLWANTFTDAFALPADAVAWLIDEDRDGHRDKEELFSEIRRRFSLHREVDALVSAFREDFPRHFRLESDTADALDRARSAGWRIAVVTNGGPAQVRKVEATGLAAYVDSVTVSGLVGIRKPDLGIFRAAATAAGGSLDGGWMVGDSAEADIQGAGRAGLRSVWLHRGRQWSVTEYRPTATATTFAEAVSLLMAHDA
jgi:FMN phosphatase YigB (HAD superfamily)